MLNRQNTDVLIVSSGLMLAARENSTKGLMQAELFQIWKSLIN